jgi:uncharacterized repeat protein (TIGR01451 family)
MTRRFVRNLVLVACGLGSSFTAFGQDNDNDLNEGPGMMNARREWLFRQRAYPLGFIPSDARARAVIELNRQLAERSAARSRGKTPESMQNAATTGTWTLIGPNPTLNGILTTAAWTNAIAVDPTNASVAYLGAPEGGVWKTTDAGAHWIPLTDTQPSLAIASITIDPTNHNTVYAGTGDSYLYGEGLLKTTDGGNTWSYIAAPFAGPFGDSSYFGGGAHINQIAVDPANASVVLAAVWRFPASSAGIYRSADGGNTWTQVFPGAPATSITFSPTGSVAYAAVSDYFGTALAGIYKSTDGGKSWTAANGSGSTQLPLLNAGVASVGEIRLAMAPSSPTTLYVSIEGLNSFAPLTPNSIFTSIDGGATWHPTATNPFSVQAAGNKGMVLTVHPTNANIVFVGEQNLYRSMDGGQTWAVVTSSANGAVNSLFGDIRSFGFSAGGVVFYVGCDGGPWSTGDAANQTMNWTNLTSTLATTQFYPGLSINPSNVAVAFAGSQDQGVQQYSGSSTWTTVQPCDGGWTAIDPSQTNNVYVVCETGTVQVLKSINGGTAFSAAQTGIVAADRVAFIPPLVLDPSTPQHLYFGTYRIYQSTNGAASWTPISGDLTTGTNSPTISTIAVAPSDSNRVYAGTSDGLIQTTSNATAGAAAIWTNITGTLPNRFVSQVVVDPYTATTAYAVMSGFTFGTDTQGHIFKTTNAGTTWTDISGNLPNIPADDLVVDPDVPNWLYVATDIGVYATTNGGASWTPFGNGLPRTVVSSLKLHEASRTLRAATMGRSAWDIIAPLPQPVLSISKTHSGNFEQGQQNVTYTITVSNSIAGGPTSGIVTVTDTLPAGVTLVSIAGTGWSCAATTCTRSDVLRGGNSYPPVVVTVNVAINATSPQTNQAGVSGGGSVSASISDPTTLVPAGTPPALNITKKHSGSFMQAQQGAVYTLTISNSPTAGPTSGTVTVTDTVPSALTLVSMAGPGWSCVSATCTRADVLNSAASYPPITVTVNVASNASSPQVNQASVSGGGSPGASTSDLTTVTAFGTLSVNRPKLNFGYNGAFVTSPQTVMVNFVKGIGANWTASSNQPNITVFPTSGSGNGSIQVTALAGASGTITVTAPGAPGSPQQIQVSVASATPTVPFGSFDTPANNTTGIAGAIPVTGWALDNIEVTSVGIWREPIPGETPQSNGLMFIGTAVFVADARPDVQAAFPNTPWNYRAGWGYSLLTNFLPHSGGSAGPGNGSFNLHALAVNKAGQTFDLGTRTITVDNAHASKPFGTIDTPTQGGTASGNAFVNFGWALTQNPNCIPIDGSTLTVYVDGVPIGHPNYNQPRSDIQGFFPGLCNTNGAIGFFYIDTTQLANGVHTIAWLAVDNVGHNDGLGSRYFTVANAGGGNAPAVDEPLPSSPDDVITVRRNLEGPRALRASADGSYAIEMEELGLLELRLGAAHGHMLVAGQRTPLPVGSTLKAGVFYWQAGLGFLGDYQLVFERPDGSEVRVQVRVRPKRFSDQ